MVIVKVIGQDPLQVHFSENDHVVKALAPDRSDHSFAVRILPRRTGCNDDFVNPSVLDAVSEVVSVEAIPVSDSDTVGPRQMEMPRPLAELSIGPWDWS